MTLLETLVAVAVLAVGVLAVQRLANDSVAAMVADGERTRAMLAAQRLLTDAALAPPEPGQTTGTVAGLGYTRDVRPTVHPGLREVRVRVGDCELVELVRVPVT